CCGDSGVASGRSTTIAAMVASRSLQSGTLAASMTTPRGPPCSSTSRLVFVPGLPRSVGFLPTFFPPNAGFAQATIGTLPVPIHTSQIVTGFDQKSPEALKNAVVAEALEPAMGGAVAAVPFGKFIPWAGATHAEDKGVEQLSQIGPRSAGGLLGVMFIQDQLQSVPKVIRDFPDGVRGRCFGLPCHDSQLLSWSCLFRRKRG